MPIVFIQIIEECQRHLKPRNANFCFYAKKFGSIGNCDKREKWYQTEYSVQGERSGLVAEKYYTRNMPKTAMLVSKL